MSILLPLYVYPWPGTWDPLYWAANTNPHLNFTVIVNPCSGPCVNGTPEQPYIDEMPKLKDWPNIRTLGYVATNYTNKPIDVVLDEIRYYANWTNNLGSEKYAVDGIFFDETPGAYDWRSYDWLKAARDEVKSHEGLGQRVVVHNPGTIPYPTWNYLNLTDITVIFEETFTKFIDASYFNNIKSLPSTLGAPKSAFAIMLHSVPNIPDELVDWMVKELRDLVGWSFVSSVGTPGEYWHSFSSIFGSYIGKFAALA